MSVHKEIIICSSIYLSKNLLARIDFITNMDRMKAQAPSFQVSIHSPEQIFPISFSSISYTYNIMDTL
jgi:hypothetical protein